MNRLSLFGGAAGGVAGLPADRVAGDGGGGGGAAAGPAARRRLDVRDRALLPLRRAAARNRGAAAPPAGGGTRTQPPPRATPASRSVPELGRCCTPASSRAGVPVDRSPSWCVRSVKPITLLLLYWVGRAGGCRGVGGEGVDTVESLSVGRDRVPAHGSAAPARASSNTRVPPSATGLGRMAHGEAYCAPCGVRPPPGSQSKCEM